MEALISFIDPYLWSPSHVHPGRGMAGALGTGELKALRFLFLLCLKNHTHCPLFWNSFLQLTKKCTVCMPTNAPQNQLKL